MRKGTQQSIDPEQLFNELFDPEVYRSTLETGRNRITEAMIAAQARTIEEQAAKIVELGKEVGKLKERS